MKSILHVGCGGQDIRSMPGFFQDGTWDEIRYDIDPGARPHIQGDLRDMSIIETGSIDAVYSSHNIEHVSSFEVNVVLAEFRRVLVSSGFALILCPDIVSVAQAISAGALEKTLYVSPAGPINSLDIVYGHQQALQRGQSYMAHKTAFSADTLAQRLLTVGFFQVRVVRDKIFGLQALAFASDTDDAEAEKLARAALPAPYEVMETFVFRRGDLNG